MTHVSIILCPAAVTDVEPFDIGNDEGDVDEADVAGNMNHLNSSISNIILTLLEETISKYISWLSYLGLSFGTRI